MKLDSGGRPAMITVQAMKAMPMKAIAPDVPNGIYTLFNPRTGQHRTFRIRTWNKDGELLRVVGLLTGPENTTDYTDFGFLLPNRIAVWKQWRGIANYEALARAFTSMLFDGPGGPLACQGVTMHVSKRCLRCNRELTTPESIANGIGPECAGK